MQKSQKTKVAETTSAAAGEGESHNGATANTEQKGGNAKVEPSSKPTASKKDVGASSANQTQATKRPASIQHDPTASKAFKSLFTTSSDAKKAVKTHFAGNRD